VYEQLRIRIMTGTPAPGARVTPVDLAAVLDTSVVAVRDALERLLGEGLVEPEHGEWYRIAPLDRARALETLEVYRAVLVAAAGWAVPRVTDEDLALVRLASARYLAAIEAGNWDGAAEAFDGFLGLILSAARNRELDLVVRPIQTRFLRVLRLYLPGLGLAGELVREHVSNLADIEARDTERVVAHFTRRIDDFRLLIEAADEAPWTRVPSATP